MLLWAQEQKMGRRDGLLFLLQNQLHETNIYNEPVILENLVSNWVLKEQVHPWQKFMISLTVELKYSKYLILFRTRT